MKIIDEFNLLSGEALVSARFKICEGCPSKQMLTGLELCKECNCFIKFKTRFKKSECPLEKW